MLLTCVNTMNTHHHNASNCNSGPCELFPDPFCAGAYNSLIDVTPCANKGSAWPRETNAHTTSHTTLKPELHSHTSDASVSCHYLSGVCAFIVL